MHAFDRVHVEMPENVAGSLVLLERRPDMAVLRAGLEDEAAAAPALRARLDCTDAPRWTPLDGFRAWDNVIVRHSARDLSLEELLADRAALNRAILSEHRPAWRLQITMLPAASGRSACALLFVWHHALFDGMRFIEMLSRLDVCRARSAERRRLTAPAPIAGQRSPQGVVMRTLIDAGAYAGCMTTALASALSAPAPASADRPIAHFCAHIPRRSLRAAARANGCTSEVLLYGIAGRLINAARRTHGTTARPRPLGRVMVPVRSARLDPANPLGNRFLPAFYTPRGDLIPEHLARLARAIGHAKTLLGPYHAYVYERLVAAADQLERHMPGRALERVRRGWLGQFAGSCSIIPGPRPTARLAGAPIVSLHILMPRLGPRQVSVAWLTGAADVTLVATYDAGDTAMRDRIEEQFEIVMRRLRLQGEDRHQRGAASTGGRRVNARSEPAG